MFGVWLTIFTPLKFDTFALGSFYTSQKENIQIIYRVQLVCHGNLVPEMENQLYYPSSSLFIFCFTPQARCGLSYPALQPPLVQLACQSLCCTCISCHLPTLERPSMNTGGDSGTHRDDVLGLRTSLPCK